MSLGRRLTLLIAILCLLLGTSELVQAQGPGAMYTLRQRFGVDVAPSFTGIPSFPGLISDYRGVEDLGLGWYSDWTTRRDPPRPGNIEFVQLVQLRPWPPRWTQLQEAVQANPGSVWIVGNEPETRGQGELAPAEYAPMYHEAYHFIKQLDPTAQIAIGGVVMPSPLRLRWLDLCLESYRATYGVDMPIDIWNIHVQILQEKRNDWGCGVPYGLPEDVGRTYTIVDNCNVEIFKQLVFEFCIWLYERGQRHKPVIISEYGVLMPSSYLPEGDRSVLKFMQGTFDFLLSARNGRLGCPNDGGRLVQRWAWFSLNFPFYERTPGGFNGALYDWQHPDQLTVFGWFFRDYMSQKHLFLPYALRPSLLVPTIPAPQAQNSR